MSLLPLLQAARRQVENETTVLLALGLVLMRLLPLLADAHSLVLILCALDAVPLALGCLDAPLHLLGGEIGPDGRIAGLKAPHGLALHDVDLLLVEVQAVYDTSLLLALGDSEGHLHAAAARARGVVALSYGRTLKTAGLRPRLPLWMVDRVLLSGRPAFETRRALQEAGFQAAPDSDPVPGFIRQARRNSEDATYASTG